MFYSCHHWWSFAIHCQVNLSSFKRFSNLAPTYTSDLMRRYSSIKHSPLGTSASPYPCPSRSRPGCVHLYQLGLSLHWLYETHLSYKVQSLLRSLFSSPKSQWSLPLLRRIHLERITCFFILSCLNTQPEGKGHALSFSLFSPTYKRLGSETSRAETDWLMQIHLI